MDDQTASRDQRNPGKSASFKTLFRGWFIHYWDIPREKSKWTDVAIVILTIFIAIAAFWSACVFDKQLREMQNQTKILGDEAKNSERAWMGLFGSVKINSLDMAPPRFRLTASYQIKNFGHGPAYKIVATGWFSTSEEDLNMMGKSVCAATMPFTEGTIRVGPGIPQPPPLGTMRFPEQPLDETIGEPNDPFTGDYVPNLKKIWFVGCVTYRDQFNVPHWTRWCMTSPDFGPVIIDKNVALHFCNSYNDTDD